MARNQNLPVDGRNAHDRARELNDAFTTDEDGVLAQEPKLPDEPDPYTHEDAEPRDLVDEIVERDEDEAMLSARRTGAPAVLPEMRARLTADDADEEEEEATDEGSDAEVRSTADAHAPKPRTRAATSRR